MGLPIQEMLPLLKRAMSGVGRGAGRQSEVELQAVRRALEEAGMAGRERLAPQIAKGPVQDWLPGLMPDTADPLSMSPLGPTGTRNTRNLADGIERNRASGYSNLTWEDDFPGPFNRGESVPLSYPGAAAEATDPVRFMADNPNMYDLDMWGRRVPKQTSSWQSRVPYETAEEDAKPLAQLLIQYGFNPEMAWDLALKASSRTRGSF